MSVQKYSLDEINSDAQLLAKIKNVDGTGSGLDADTVDGVQGALLGVGGAGYAWVDETANRVQGTTYTNTYGKPIFTEITCVDSSAVDGIEVDGVLINSLNGTTGKQHLSAIVPANSIYKVTGSGGIIVIWAELK